MSIHPSLRGANTLTGERSVLSRFERIQKLAKGGKLDTEKSSAHGLPKVRTHFKVIGAKKKAEAEADAAAAAAAPAPVAAGKGGAAKGAPAKGAPAKGAPAKGAAGKGAAGKSGKG